MNTSSANSVLVVGAGIIGICSALALQKKGYQVTLVDPEPPASLTSSGNAGGLAVTEVLPLSMPGVLWKAPKWLLDPRGPLNVRWQHLPLAMPWFWRFMRAGSKANVDAIIPALTELLKPVYADFKPLLKQAGVEQLLHKNGSLTVYHYKKTYDAEARDWALKREQGIRFETVTADDIRQLEPALAPIFEMGVRNLDWGHLDDPHQVATALFDLFMQQGGSYQQWAVREFVIEQGAVVAVLSESGERHQCDHIVITAGVWSRELLKQLRCSVSLESERGYHVTFDDPDNQLNNMIISAEGKFVMTPMSMGLRVAGTAEFSGLTAAANNKRSDVLLERAQAFFPKLDTQRFSRWDGHRPATPDSLPVIGTVPNYPNVHCAFGHGHLGLTMAPTTGRLIANLVSDPQQALIQDPVLKSLTVDRF